MHVAKANDSLFGRLTDLVDDLVELGQHLFVEHVHRLFGHVPGDERDAVLVGVDLEILVIGHVVLPGLKRAR